MPHGVRHELSSPVGNTGTVGSNLTGVMDFYMCVYSVFVLSCMYVCSGPVTADSPSRESFRL
jgi:hypothetical protein